MNTEQLKVFVGEYITVMLKDNDKAIGGYLEKINEATNLIYLSTRKNQALSCSLDFYISIDDIAYIRRTIR